MLIWAFDAWRNIGLRKIGDREFARRERHSLSKSVVARNDVDLRVYRRVYTDASLHAAGYIPSSSPCIALFSLVLQSIDRPIDRTIDLELLVYNARKLSRQVLVVSGTLNTAGGARPMRQIALLYPFPLKLYPFKTCVVHILFLVKINLVFHKLWNCVELTEVEE